jgi:serine/threonine-protein kinase
MPVDALESDVGRHLEALGEVFATIEHHDSGNTSWGVRIEGERWFVKAAAHAEGVGWLQSAVRFHAAVQHPHIVPLHRAVPVAGGGLALLYPWVDGEILNDPFAPGSLPRHALESAYRRFRSLPVDRILPALDAIFDAHVAVARAGYAAVDFYDGCVIYDFASGAVALVDLDLYCPAPYELDADRQFGSTRFMAPEEFRRGATIDERTTVYTLGRTAFVFLSADERGAPDRGLWRGTDAQHAVAAAATADDPDARLPTVEAFVDAWRLA